MSAEPQDTEGELDEDDAIALEAGAPLPPREVMSIVDPTTGATLFPGDPVDPAMTPGQGIDERVIPE
jgi:hypothetical protein